MANKNLYYTIKDVAIILKKSESTIRAYLRKNTIKHIKKNNVIKISNVHLSEYLDSIKNSSKSLSPSNNKKIKIIDLFAGIGGIRYGFEKNSEFESVFSNDFDKNCKKKHTI